MLGSAAGFWMLGWALKHWDAEERGWGSRWNWGDGIELRTADLILTTYPKRGSKIHIDRYSLVTDLLCVFSAKVTLPAEMGPLYRAKFSCFFASFAH